MRGRTIGWTAIAVATLVVGTLVWRGMTRIEPPAVSVRPAPDEATKRVTALRATMKECQRVGRRTRVIGVVENLGNTALSSVTVQSIWKNSDGLVLGTGLVYAVGDSDPVMPGDSREFEDTTELSNVAKCNVEAIDWFSSDGSVDAGDDASETATTGHD